MYTIYVCWLSAACQSNNNQFLELTNSPSRQGGRLRQGLLGSLGRWRTTWDETTRHVPQVDFCGQRSGIIETQLEAATCDYSLSHAPMPSNRERESKDKGEVESAAQLKSMQSSCNKAWNWTEPNHPNGNAKFQHIYHKLWRGENNTMGKHTSE